MIKNPTNNQIILISIAIVLLLLAAFALYLLQDPAAPLPFGPQLPTSTRTPLPPSPTRTSPPTFTVTPTRRTSYTPFAPTDTVEMGTQPGIPSGSATVTPQLSGTTTSSVPGNTPTINLTASATRTITPSSSAAAGSPTATQTLETGEYIVTGRIVQNGTPVANVLVAFADDVSPRQDRTDEGGHYSFITLAPGTNFTLKFAQADNPQLTPVPEIALLARFEGTLPNGINPIELPDLEVSLNLDGELFVLESPNDGAAISAESIGLSNPLPFIWSQYDQGATYTVELGPTGSATPIWTSSETTLLYLTWDGTMDNGNHITEGTYWWRVAASKQAGNYTQIFHTHTWDIIFNP